MISIVVFLYAASVHAAMIVGVAANAALLPRLMTPSLGVAHAIVCVVGAVLGVLFIRHSLRNPLLSWQSRLLWLPVIACGYGLVFYWYNHIRARAAS